MPTAGLGKRFKAGQPKALVLLNKKPVFIHTLEAFEKHPAVHSVIVVVHPDHLSSFSRSIRKFRLKKVAAVVPGGKTRQRSVYNGLKFLDSDTQVVLVHDGVRPLVSCDVIDRGLAALKGADAVITAVFVKPTIKEVDPRTFWVHKTLERGILVEVQTPQAFRREILVKAHQKFRHKEATDDAMLVELMRVPVKVVAGDYKNIKITTPEDLLIAREFMRKNRGGLR